MQDLTKFCQTLLVEGAKQIKHVDDAMNMVDYLQVLNDYITKVQNDLDIMKEMLVDIETLERNR